MRTLLLQCCSAVRSHCVFAVYINAWTCSHSGWYVCMTLFTQGCHVCRCPDLGGQRRLQVAKLLYERGRQLRGSPMLFELVTMLPDALTAASRSPAQTAVLPCSEHPAQAARQPTDQQMQSKDRAAQHRQRPGKHEHSQRAINVAQESALLQVGLCQVESYEGRADMGCLQARITRFFYDGLLVSSEIRHGLHSWHAAAGEVEGVPDQQLRGSHARHTGRAPGP